MNPTKCTRPPHLPRLNRIVQAGAGAAGLALGLAIAVQTGVASLLPLAG